ncbi:hypothetical protein NO932_06585 [Pelagibacterium sp. 26DY04]|uniref:portal protein n=1 Tax=Pelagibacterium sp. 26DY04 TaxID=2967130 RepID=UPI00281590CB|nr:hypothetical protein [Pelagibacterium sp. 26DY04]WMT88272.1 hypothetical protein NO932_06585 [Pelagibacterium sp. 26DY04]
MNQTGYQIGSSSAQGGVSRPGGKDHAELKRGYLSYLETKAEEIKEQQEARRYYHGSQWTAKQIQTFNRRRQPVVTYNRIGRKINAVVGLLERQRQDPRGFPRTPEHEEGAEIATAVLRYVLDQQEWPSVSPECGLDGAVDGIGGVEILLEQGDLGDIEIGLEVVDPASFFYDPRSLKPDFSDARYMGVGKWADLDAVIEMYPDRESELRASVESGTELTSNPDYDEKWITGGEDAKRIRLVDHWCIKNGVWHWYIYTGALILDEGESYLKDEKGRSICKFIMYSANVDQDGDRYGFVRNMRSSQDEINQRRSKGLHLLNSRRVILPEGTGADVEKIRQEAARPDGVIQYPQGTQAPEFDDAAKAAELNGHLGFLQDAKDEIENYGFNPALMGQGVDRLSGRAMQIQQQAGIAELGPYLLAYKGWKLRVYRTIWSAVQEHWTAERWIRVTDDENVAQFMAINQPATDEFGYPMVDPATGQQALVNALGALDVDIIIDEGPDTINMQADAYDTLSIMATKGQNVPPELLIELSPLHGSIKKKAIEILQKASQPGPVQQRAIAAEMQGKEAEAQEKVASATLKQAQAVKAVAEARTAGMGQQGETINPGEIAEQQARTVKTLAEARKISMETDLLPLERLQPAETTTNVSI